MGDLGILASNYIWKNMLKWLKIPPKDSQDVIRREFPTKESKIKNWSIPFDMVA